MEDVPDASDRPTRRVFVSGASGFVGTALVRALVEAGYGVSALVNTSPVRVHGTQITSVPGGLFDPAAVAQAIRGCDAAVHLVGIIRENPRRGVGGVTFERMHVEATRRVLEAARDAGVGRYLHMSALGTRPHAVSAYHRTKWQAEELVRASATAWTIVRPSLILGEGGEFLEQARAWAHGRAAPWLFMPYFGFGVLGTGGSAKVQPVAVEDVALAFVRALERPETAGRTYDVAGPDVMDWPTMHRLISTAARGRPKRAIGIPSWYASLLTKVVPASLLPFNAAQVQMAREDNTGDTAALRRDLGIEPQTPAALASID